MFTATGLLLNRTTPSPLTTLNRQVMALLRGPMPVPTEFLSTNDCLRMGNWYTPKLKTIPNVTDAQTNDFGTQQSGSFSVDLALGVLPTPVYPDPEPRLTHRVYVAIGAGNAYTYHAISQVNYTIQPGDFYEVDVQVDPQSYDLTGNTGGVELDFADGTAARSFAVVDQFGNSVITFNATAAGAVGAWVTRRIDLSLVVGKTIIQWDLVNESDTASKTHIVHYRNLKITDGAGKTRLVVWASGSPTVNGVAYAARNGQSIVTNGEALRFATYTPVGSIQYTYWKISTAGGRTVFSDDVLEYEVFVPASSADLTSVGSIELDFSDGTSGRSVPLLDQFGVHIAYNNASGNGGVGKWIRRRISLASVVGKTITFVSLVSESDTAGEHVAYYRNIGISDGNGFLSLVIYGGGAPALNVVNYQYVNFGTTVGVVNSARLPGSAEEWLADIKNKTVDLDLITRVTREDGSQTDFINERRGVVKSISRKREGITLNVVDVDQAALKQMFPIKLFTVADHVKLYKDHVNRPVPQGVGLGEKIPCTYIDNLTFKYAVCEVIGTAPAILTVYRGKQTGQGRIVASTEYAVSTAVVAGTTYLLLTFTREQLDFDNTPFVIEADVFAPGSRLAADELARVLVAIGLSVDTSDFADAAAYHQTILANVDAWYTKQVPASSIVAALLQVARGWLSQTLGGNYSLTVDMPRTAQRLLWDESDQMQVDERSEPEYDKTVTLRYRHPRQVEGKSEYAGNLSRGTPGASGEKIFVNEFVYDHATADRVLCYLMLKEQRADIRANFYGVVLRPGELVAVNSPLVLDGWRALAARQINRVPDGCQVTGEEYREADYTYTPGTLPADATNGYSPDYTYTPPLAPTALAIISSTTALDDSGKAFTAVNFSAVPPALNWATLWGRFSNTPTGELSPAVKLELIGGVYKTTVGRLQPATAHTLQVWARNAAGLDGAVASLAHNTAAYAGAPPTPSTPVVTQLVGRSVEATVTTPSYAHHKRVEWVRRNVTLSTSLTLPGENSARANDTNGLGYGNSGYGYKCRFVDASENPGPYSAETILVLSTQIDDSHIIGLGVGTGSLAANAVVGAKITNGEVYQGKLKYTTYNNAYTVPAGGVLDMAGGSFFVEPKLWSANTADFTVSAGGPAIGSITQAIRVTNNAAVARVMNFDYRTIDI